MLKNIPPILSPELLAVLDEMGHGDRICIGDGNFPGASMAAAEGAILVRADGHGVPALLDAIMQVIPLDEYVETPAMIMEVMAQDADLEIPIIDEYKKIVQEPFFALIDELGPAMRKIDPEMEIRPAKVLSRIYRDTRFSQDKAPYRDHHWIAFRPAGTERYGQPFYWFEFGPDRLSWGLGVWGENREAMNALRARILRDPEGVSGVLARCEKHRFAIGGDTFRRLKIPPQVPEPLRTLYASRSLYIEHPNPRFEWAFSPDLPGRLVRDYRALEPAWRLLRECVAEAMAQAPAPEAGRRVLKDDWTD